MRAVFRDTSQVVMCGDREVMVQEIVLVSPMTAADYEELFAE